MLSKECLNKVSPKSKSNSINKSQSIHRINTKVKKSNQTNLEVVIPAYKHSSPSNLVITGTDRHPVVAHNSCDKVSLINIISRLTYINLIKNKLLSKDYYIDCNIMNKERDIFIPIFSRVTMMIAYLYRKILGPSSINAGLNSYYNNKANIWVDINKDPLDYLLAIKQAYTS